MKVGVKKEENLENPLERLLFEPCCKFWVNKINHGRTARINSVDDYNNGLVLTSRPLKKNELFEVRLDKIVTKWIGSIEIGVITNSPMELAFPCMINSRSDTWIMSGQGVMHNGIAFIYHYGQNLDKLQIGDRVGVMKNESSILHFYVNGEDQGDVTTLSEEVYGLINLYGQAVEATIVDVNFQNNLTFHHLHGKNARITNNGLTATRNQAFEIFNDSVVVENRTSDGQMFQASIDKMRENICNQQSTSVIEMWDQIGIKQNKDLLLDSITQIKQYISMKEDFWGSQFNKNHERNIQLLKTNSLRFDCYQIEIKSEVNYEEEVPKDNFSETICTSEFKPHFNDLDNSCLSNCICFTK